MDTRQFPTFARCAIEVLLASGERTKERLRELIDDYAGSYHYLEEYEIEYWYQQAITKLGWRLKGFDQ